MSGLCWDGAECMVICLILTCHSSPTRGQPIGCSKLFLESFQSLVSPGSKELIISLEPLSPSAVLSVNSVHLRIDPVNKFSKLYVIKTNVDSNKYIG